MRRTHSIPILRAALALAFLLVPGASDARSAENVPSSDQMELVRPSGVDASAMGTLRVPTSLRIDVPSLAVPDLDLPPGVLAAEIGDSDQVRLPLWMLTYRSLGRPVAEEAAVFGRMQSIGACVGPLPSSHEELLSTAPRVVMRLTRGPDGGAIARFAAQHPAADMARMTNCFRDTFRTLQLGAPAQ